MSIIGATLSMRGDVESSGDIRIQGQVIGSVWSDGHEVVIEQGAAVTGDILAHDIIVLGSVAGTLLASGVVEIHASAHVAGRVVSKRLFLEDGAWFHGSATPQQLVAALEVARYRLRQLQKEREEATEEPIRHPALF
jgi:cytoskeletal protein CcmA (bactofilin family)